MNPVRLLVVTDNECDLEDVELGFQVAHIPYEIVQHERGVGLLSDKDGDTLIIDYGGAAVFGVSEPARYEVRQACKWAEEHPGKPMVIWTGHTRMLYEWELQDQFGHLPNVLSRFAPGKFMGEDPVFWAQYRQWLGLPPET